MTSLEHDLLGVWTLVSYIHTNLDTGERFTPLGESPIGLSIYTADGYMSAQISRRIPIGDEQNYMFYAGTFVLDTASRHLSHHILVSPLPEWIGTDQVRLVTCDANSLELSLATPRSAGGSLWASTTIWIRPNAISALTAEG